MNPDQIALVRSSFAAVGADPDAVARMFYQRLFHIAPQLRPLFPGELVEQRRKLMATLLYAVEQLDRPETLLPALRRLGERHKGYGVRDDHYPIVANALLWTLEQGLGEGFTPEVRAAWIALWRVVAGTMQEAARAAA